MNKNPKKRKSNFNPNPKPFKGFRPQGQSRPRGQPFGQRRTPFTPYRAGPPQPKPEEEEHYWTAKQWEEWATNEYENNPDAQLPAWFIEAMENNEE